MRAAESGHRRFVSYVGPNPLPDPKPAHTGERGPPIGPWRYVVVRIDGKMLGPFDSRHHATGYIGHLEALGTDADWYEAVPVREGQIPVADVIDPNHWYDADAHHTGDRPDVLDHVTTRRTDNRERGHRE